LYICLVSASLNSRWRKSEEYQEQLATCEGQSVEDYVTSLDFTDLVAALQTGTEDLKLAGGNVLDPDTLNLDPDPAFQVNPDPDPGL
jgi:hypothetical protein